MRDNPFIAATRDLARKAQLLRPARPMTPLPPPGDGGMDAGYWYGYSEVLPRPAKGSIDRPIYQVPTMEREPVSDPPNQPAWVNTNCPPWICPPAWAVPVDLMLEVCVPSYELAVLMSPVITMPADYMLIIRNVCWVVQNAALFDVFQFDFLVDGNVKVTVEDMYVQATASPAHQYALATTLRMMPTHIVVDRNHALSVRATLRGPISLGGLSPYFPGQPITTGDCTMQVFLNGWWANMRENLDGGPRPTDLGDAGSITLEDDQSRGAYP